MARVSYTVKFDLTDNGFFDTGWRIKQGDSGNVQIVALITNNGVDMFDSSITPQIAFKRPDGKSIISNMTIQDNNYVYAFVGNELAVAGPVVIDVKFTDSEGRISTNSCKFECIEDTIGYDPDGSHTYDNPVSELVAIAEEVSVDSEAWAVGTRNGVPVTEGDETYHNNAKYYAEQGGGGSAADARIDEYEASGYLGKNLFNKLNKADKQYIAENGTYATGNNFSYATFIKIEPNTTYNLNAKNFRGTLPESGRVRVHEYNSSKTWLRQISTTEASNLFLEQTFTTSSDAEYIQFSYQTIATDFVQLEKGSSSSNYVKYAKPNTELTEIVDANYSNGFLSDCLAEKGQIIVGKSWVLANASDRAILNVDVEPNTEYTISIGNMAVDAINYIEKTDAESKQAIYTNTITGPLTRITSATTKVMCIQFSKASITLADVQNCVVRVDKGKQRVPSNTELQNAINTMLVTKSVTNSAVIEIGAYSSTSFNIILPTDVDYSNYNLVSVLPTSVSYGATVTWASITNNILTVNLGNARASAVSIPSGNFKANILLAIK